MLRNAAADHLPATMLVSGCWQGLATRNREEEVTR
jgi:hypothetical protein